MPSAWAYALVAGLVSAVFAAFVWRQYAARRRPHQLAWAAGLTAYAVAAILEAWAALSGWSVPLYRVYFPLASGLVGLLGWGTVLLAGSPRTASFFGVFVALGVATAGIGQFAFPLEAETPITVEIAEGQEETRPFREWGNDLGVKAIPFPHPARVAFLLLNIVGGVTLIGGALASWWKTRSHGVLLIGLGALLPFTGGSLSTLGLAEARILAQFAGIAVMFAGYALGGRRAPVRARPADAPAPRA